MSDEKRYVHNIPAARRLRTEQTATEAVLWAQLRNRRLGGYKFRRQHAVQAYVLDFFCPAADCAIEIDGPIHDSPAQRTRDLHRQHALERLGIWFIRIPSDRVESDMEGVLAFILEQLSRHQVE